MDLIYLEIIKGCPSFNLTFSVFITLSFIILPIMSAFALFKN